jgi:hypothetical protein
MRLNFEGLLRCGPLLLLFAMVLSSSRCFVVTEGLMNSAFTLPEFLAVLW